MLPDEQFSTHNIYLTPYTVKQCSPNESSSIIAASGQRPKHQRAAVACDRCRHAKEKVQTGLLETVANMSTSFADIKSSISGADSRLGTYLAYFEEAMKIIVAAIQSGAAQPTPLSVKTEPRASWDVEEPIAAFILDDDRSNIPPGYYDQTSWAGTEEARWGHTPPNDTRPKKSPTGRKRIT
ncbi:hypothetical protein PoMZ_10018 [Pyricularia oryzae]|uniref:Uncharacterized protein n=1 Tax=Pyricularia oryzae TaxID=318829 RepID=A0A4P7MZ22_PYROR|nr:hypothetical protein PoMZ_10018 [Pyricularia oryzae]